MIFRMFGFLALIALALTIPGGIVGTHVKPGQGHVGLTLRRVSAGIFAGLYVLLFLAHLGCWTYRYQMRTYRFKVGSLSPPLRFCADVHAVNSFSSG